MFYLCSQLPWTAWSNALVPGTPWTTLERCFSWNFDVGLWGAFFIFCLHLCGPCLCSGHCCRNQSLQIWTSRMLFQLHCLPFPFSPWGSVNSSGGSTGPFQCMRTPVNVRTSTPHWVAFDKKKMGTRGKILPFSVLSGYCGESWCV